MGVRNTSGVRKDVRSGKLHWVLDIRYIDKHGKKRRLRRDASIQTSAGAHAEAVRVKMQIATAGAPLEAVASVPTFGSFVGEGGQFDLAFMPTFRPATRVRYEALLRHDLRAAFGSIPLDEIGPGQVRAFTARLAERGVQARGAQNLLRTVLRAAVDVGVLTELPSFPSLKTSRKLPDAPTAEEIAAMLGHARGWLRLAIALASYAGLRMGEVRALEVRDVDLAHGLIHVRHALSEDEVTTPKSGHERVVPIAPPLLVALAEAVRSKLPRTRLVLNGEGNTPTRQSVLTRLKALQERQGLPERSFHALRHFFCSALVRGGVNVEAVRVLAGHADLATTQRYVHAVAVDLRAAVGCLGATGGQR